MCETTTTYYQPSKATDPTSHQNKLNHIPREEIQEMNQIDDVYLKQHIHISRTEEGDEESGLRAFQQPQGARPPVVGNLISNLMQEPSATRLLHPKTSINA